MNTKVMTRMAQLKRDTDEAEETARKARELAGLQLQFFDKATRSYAPSAHQGDLRADSARAAACGRPWRLARPDRPTKNPKHKPPQSTSSSRSIAQVQIQYCDWAQAKGLSRVTIFADKPVALGGFTGDVHRVDAEQYFTVTEETES